MKDLAQLQEEGKAVAEQHGVDTLFATSDGQFFLPGKQSLAQLHAREIKGVVHTLTYTSKAAEGEVKAPAAPKAAPKPRAAAKPATNNK